MLPRIFKPLVIIGFAFGFTAAFAADDASQQPQAAPQPAAPAPSGEAASRQDAEGSRRKRREGPTEEPLSGLC